MITIFNREEVYNGFSMQEFSRIRDCLSMNSIKYSSKCVNNNSPGLFCSRAMGKFGEDMKYSYEYYIYVHKEDYEKACYVMNRK